MSNFTRTNGASLGKETMNKINTVLGRAYAMGIGGIQGDTRFDHFMDMEVACRFFGDRIDLDLMLSCDDFSFAHDFIGIRNHIDRPNCEYVDDLFLPRCCREKVD